MRKRNRPRSRTLRIGLNPIRLSLFLSGFLLLSSITGAQESSVLPFADISPSDQYYEAIEYGYNEGFIQGYPDQSIQAYSDLNRAEALKIIVESLLENVEPALSESQMAEQARALPFGDVNEEAWYYPMLKTAYERGIIQGYANGKFEPGLGVNRAESLKMIVLALGVNPQEIQLNDAPGNDVNINSWYSPYLQFGREHAMIVNDSGGNLKPDALVKRGELLDMIYRFKNNGQFSGQVEYGKATWYGNAVLGNGTASGEMFDPSSFTAAHRTLPFGTVVRVTNPINGKVVDVIINDRGPYGEGRIIDLSSGAFQQLASLGTGVIDVKIEVVYN